MSKKEKVKADGAGAVGGASSGAAMGTSIMPGWGTAIGAVAGGLLGAFGGNLMGGGDAEKEAQRARDLQQQALALQFPQGMQDYRNNFYGSGLQDDLYRYYGGDRVLQNTVDPEALAKFVASRPDLGVNYAKIDELKAKLNELNTGQYRGMPQWQVEDARKAIINELDKVQKEGGADTATVMREFANANTSQGWRFNPQTGKAEQVQHYDPIQRDLTFNPDARLEGLNNEIYNQTLSNARPTEMALAQYLNNQSGNINNTTGALSSLIRDNQGATGLADMLLRDQNQNLTTDGNSLRGAYQPNQMLMDQINQTIGDARGLGNNLNADTEALISGMTAQLDQDTSSRIEALRDEMARNGLTGSGFEKQQIQKIQADADKAKQTQMAQLRLQANQQNFNNNMSAQGNVAGLLNTASGLESNILRNQISGLQAGNALGNQRLDNANQYNNMLNSNLSRDNFNANLINNISGLNSSMNDASLQNYLARLNQPLNSNLQAQGVLLNNDARRNNIGQQNLANLNNERGFLANIATNANANAGYASAQQGQFANQMFQNAQQQSQASSQALANTINNVGTSLYDVYNANQNQYKSPAPSWGQQINNPNGLSGYLSYS